MYYLSRREKDAILSAILGAVFLGGIFAYSGVQVYQYEKQQCQAIAEEVGFDVIDVQEAELSQINEDFKATIKCTHKETKESLIVEYKITSTDFIVMNQPDSNPWEYISMYIIPNQDPIFVGTEKEYKNYLKSETTPAPQPEEK